MSAYEKYFLWSNQTTSNGEKTTALATIGGLRVIHFWNLLPIRIAAGLGQKPREKREIAGLKVKSMQKVDEPKLEI